MENIEKTTQKIKEAKGFVNYLTSYEYQFPGSEEDLIRGVKTGPYTKGAYVGVFEKLKSIIENGISLDQIGISQEIFNNYSDISEKMKNTKS